MSKNLPHFVDEHLDESEASLCKSATQCITSLQQLTEDIELSVLPSIEQDRLEIQELFKKIDRMQDRVIPAINENLEQLESLVEHLNTKISAQNNSSKVTKKLDWTNVFTGLYKSYDNIPGESSPKASRSDMVKSHEQYSTNTPEGITINLHSEKELIAFLNN